MSKKLFGTDGIRGKANQAPMDPETIVKIAAASAAKLRINKHRGSVVIGKDTRLSGDMIESALFAGFTAAGLDVKMIGVMTTPGVAFLTRKLDADFGVMITASHNPYEDNGIKFFGPDGFKLSDDTEQAIESLVDQVADVYKAVPSGIGRVYKIDSEQAYYVDHLKNSMPLGTRFENMRIVIDCANGAASKIAPQLFEDLGAEVIVINNQPDGININKNCGATSTEHLQEVVVESKADIGLALDGDADRLIVVDEQGKTVNGDQIITLIADAWHKKGKLKKPEVAATIMSNIGMERFLASKGIKLQRTNVGDRYVLEYMRENGCNLGGEQSGHIVLSDYATTGDGLMSALQILLILNDERSRPASEICKVFKPVPQIMKSVKYTHVAVLEDNIFTNAVNDAEGKIGDNGRILIRKSGTEPVIRIMAEGDDSKLVKNVVDDLCNIVEKYGK